MKVVNSSKVKGTSSSSSRMVARGEEIHFPHGVLFGVVVEMGL